MKKTILLLSCAAALTMASCSQEKTTDTATTTTTSTDATATASTGDDAAYHSRAQRIAQRMATDMKITDTAVVSRIENTYYNRSRRLGELKAKYTSDTTGMSADMRGVYTDTDAEFKGILTDPTQYSAYESSRATYDESNYMDDNSASADNSGTASGVMVDNSTPMKVKDEAGNKLKVKKDGDVKIKDSEDNKLKMDADDGTIKAKPEDGKKQKIEQ
ncbi:hypothetical protein [Hymenobacter sp. GOD-10R]|uniref:hypothetical protein n=1 Tax=Hymenobacter sp. GOD-10R TaxID=3093922 RepID=UPI002D77C12E|nr:hypothetical protein [Hymenobacter sp. GOD-10R]WRQ27614.1 hypothetical protein SD425_21320 [Hymenobacter sp. GOD-10R]